MTTISSRKFLFICFSIFLTNFFIELYFKTGYLAVLILSLFTGIFWQIYNNYTDLVESKNISLIYATVNFVQYMGLHLFFLGFLHLKEMEWFLYILVYTLFWATTKLLISSVYPESARLSSVYMFRFLILITIGSFWYLVLAIFYPVALCFVPRFMGVLLFYYIFIIAILQGF